MLLFRCQQIHNQTPNQEKSVMLDTSKSVLTELALHLSYDADVNGSKFTDNPFGRLSLTNSPGDLWKRVCDVKQGDDPEQEILTELIGVMDASAKLIGNPPCRVGTLPLRTSDGSLWKRTLEVLGYEPEMIRDVVAPAIKKCLVK